MSVTRSTPSAIEQTRPRRVRASGRRGAAVRRDAGDDASPSAASRNGTPIPAAYALSSSVPRPTSPRARRDRQRGREQRPDARAPARSERDADDVRPRHAGDLGQRRDQPPLARERPAQDADERETHDRDDDPADRRAPSFWNVDSDEPSRPAVAPSPANTVVKPAMNSNVAGTARAGSCASPISPTMMPRYAGTSGTMHGARNDATPAPNSATDLASPVVAHPNVKSYASRPACSATTVS